MIPVPGILAAGHAAQTIPAITSNGGGATGTAAVTHPATAVTTVTATGTSPITFSKAGGADQALFTLNAATGVLAFASASVAGTYVVIVRATNAFGHFDQTLTVTVS